MEASGSGRRSSPWLILFVASVGLFMTLVDSTIVNIAVPAIIDDLHTTLDLIVWVINGYILTLVALYLMAGRLGDRLGVRRTFVLGMVVFTGASALCGLSHSAGELIAARAVQGAGAAILTPQVMVVAVALFPPARRGVALGFIGILTGVAAVCGPTLGGLLVDVYGWRSVFFVNVPIGVAGIVATLVLMPRLNSGRRPRFDIAGLVLGTSGVALVCFGLIEGERYHWGRVVSVVSIPAIIVTGLVLLGFFVLSQRNPHALVPGRLIRAPDFGRMSGVTCAAQFALLALYLPLGIFLQSAVRMTPLHAGLVLVALPLTSAIAAPSAGYLTDHFGGRRVLLVGLALSTVGTVLLILTVSSDAGGWRLQPALIACGLGLGLTFTPVMTMAMRYVPPDVMGSGAAVLNTTRLFGNLLAASVVGAVLQSALTAEIRRGATVAAAGVAPSARADFLVAVGRAAANSVLVPGAPGVRGSSVPTVATDAFQTLFTDSFVTALRISLGCCLIALAVAIGVSLRDTSGSVEPDEPNEVGAPAGTLGQVQSQHGAAERGE
jgi:EmrB/QacA subfamily drug resistance transporter